MVLGKSGDAFSLFIFIFTYFLISETIENLSYFSSLHGMIYENLKMLVKSKQDIMILMKNT